jgi:hypothetical protein
MRPDGLRLSGRHRAWLHSTFAVLFFSGTIWWVLHRWFQIDSGFGPQPHPAQRWLIPLHGAAAMLALVIVGTLIPLHIKRGWRARLNRPNGILLIGFVLLLTLSGYALYYSGSEILRDNASIAHTALGLFFPAMLLWHILSGRRSRRH